MRKPLSGILIVILVVLAFASSMFVDSVQANKEVNGIITSDTTWTKANSPYTLAGPVAIAKDVTLTIEPGVQVFFNSHHIQVNGTLIAKGIDNSPVSFVNGGEIRFMPSSQSWNEQTQSGCIIENGNMPDYIFTIIIDGGSPKISSSYSIAMILINSGSPLITKNRLSGESTSLTVNGGTPTISNNMVYDLPITVKGGSPIISNNTMRPDIYVCIEVTGGNPLISNNDINDCTVGISAISGVIERNYIHGTTVGIEIGNGVIRNNTLSSAQNILVKASSKPTIAYNNFEYGYVDGIQNIVLSDGAIYDVVAAYNWWGTIDSQRISQSIIDNKNDFNLGTVNFTPFLTEANPQAMPETGISTPTPTATSNPTPSQSASLSPTSTSNQSGGGIIAFLGLGLTLILISLLSLITVLLVLIVIFLWKRSVNKT